MRSCHPPDSVLLQHRLGESGSFPPCGSPSPSLVPSLRPVCISWRSLRDRPASGQSDSLHLGVSVPQLPICSVVPLASSSTWNTPELRPPLPPLSQRGQGCPALCCLLLPMFSLRLSATVWPPRPTGTSERPVLLPSFVTPPKMPDGLSLAGPRSNKGPGRRPPVLQPLRWVGGAQDCLRPETCAGQGQVSKEKVASAWAGASGSVPSPWREAVKESDTW